MQAKQVRLQQEAKALSERLHAVLKDRFIRRVGFDAETPIDKTLNYLQEVIMVRLEACSSLNCTLHWRLESYRLQHKILAEV